jgi:histidyl-tRNA synthetase
MSKTNPARGMRDFLPVDVRKREYVIGIIKQVYESYGYEPLETPAVENIETLMGKYGEEGNQLIFKILKRGGKLDESLHRIRQETGDRRQEASDSGLSSRVSRLSDLALRYDLTVPLARVVTDRRNELPKFFKRYQIQPVWRADRPARGRFREFYQCDVDAIGSKSMMVEAELILALSEILYRLGFHSFGIPVNHRRVLTAILDSSGIPEEKHVDALVALDKVPKIGAERFMQELEERGIERESLEIFGSFMSEIYSYMHEQITRKGITTRQSFTRKAFEMVSEFIGGNRSGIEGLNELGTIFDLTGHGVHAYFDASLARGLSYYNGTVFEIETGDFAGSLGGGGRYDGLIECLAKSKYRHVGFPLGWNEFLW